jgi:hypothetical protein
MTKTGGGGFRAYSSPLLMEVAMTDKPKSNAARIDRRGSKKDTEALLAAILAMIRDHPGIRPSEINRRLNRAQSDSLRATLIRRGLVRKVKEGQTTRLYAN